MKKVFRYMLLVTTMYYASFACAQSDSTKNPWTWQAYAEAYISYDFNDPHDNARPFFLYNFDIHQQPHVNLVFAKVAYSGERFRGNFSLATGTYIYANYAAEPNWARYLFEANAGYKLSKQVNLWIDAGVMPSHIGFESAVGKDNPTLTRSLCAESTPYYQTGVKLGYSSPNEKWYLGAMYLNGWQRIKRLTGNTTPAFGTQVTFKPTAQLTINSSTFIGNDKPDTARRMRYFNDLYAIMKLTDKWTITAGLDVGAEQQSKGSSEMYNWLNATAILRWQASTKFGFAARAEYFDDANGVIIATNTANGFETFGWSANADWQMNKHLLWRLEYRSFNSKDAIFEKDNGLSKINNALTTSFSVWF